MAGDIEGELALDSHPASQLPEVVGDASLSIVILTYLFLLLVYIFTLTAVNFFCQEGKEIRGRGGLVLVLFQHILHILLPSDGKALTGLASGVMKITVLEVGFAEVSQVDE